MVDLDPMDQEDEDKLRKMVRNHFLYTGSKVALAILNDWEHSKSHFVKVMPRDYKKVLNERKAAAQAQVATA